MARPAALAKKAAYYPETVVTQLQEMERDLGGRTTLVGLLTLAPLTPDLRYTLGLLGDPRSAALSLAEICARGNVLPGDLLKHLAAAALARGKLLASQAIGRGIAAVAEDILRRAAPYDDACGVCRGLGALPPPEPTPERPNPTATVCETCLGTGKLRYQPDLERQKLAVEMAQLLPKGGGIQIAQINASGGPGASVGSGAGPLDRLQQLTDRLLYEPDHSAAPDAAEPPAVDGEIDPASDPASETP